MDKYALFDTWAPTTSSWSPWVKPALFAHTPPELHPPPEFVARDASWLPAASDRCALVLDLPGAMSVELGVALVARGYRPVPLFNSCPPTVAQSFEVVGSAVDARAVLAALIATAPIVSAAALPPDAPPVFLLDANRASAGGYLSEEIFDNRSIIFAADFPSAAFLRGRGITRALIVNDNAHVFAEDLRYALRHWPAQGLSVGAINVDGSPLEIPWPRDGFFGEMRQRLWAMFTLRRNSLGGFGAIMSSSG